MDLDCFLQLRGGFSLLDYVSHSSAVQAQPFIHSMARFPSYLFLQKSVQPLTTYPSLVYLLQPI